jgi:hypothetical protein
VTRCGRSTGPFRAGLARITRNTKATWTVVENWAGIGSRARRVPSRARADPLRGGRGPRSPPHRRLDPARRWSRTGCWATGLPVTQAVAGARPRPEPPIARSPRTTSRNTPPVVVSDQLNRWASSPIGQARRARTANRPRQPRPPVTLGPARAARSRRAAPAAGGVPRGSWPVGRRAEEDEVVGHASAPQPEAPDAGTDGSCRRLARRGRRRKGRSRRLRRRFVRLGYPPAPFRYEPSTRTSVVTAPNSPSAARVGGADASASRSTQKT